LVILLLQQVKHCCKGGKKMAKNNNNRIVVPEARQALEQLKLEIANELGINNYDNIDKGELPSRVNGYVGGYMVRRLVESAQNQMAGNKQL
jgi:hypothetical protein